MAKDTRISARLDEKVFQMLNELMDYYRESGTMENVNSSKVINEAIRNLHALKLQSDSSNGDVLLDVMKTQIEETMQPVVQSLLANMDAMTERVYLSQKLMLVGMSIDNLGSDAQKIKNEYLDETKDYEKAIELKLNENMER